MNAISSQARIIEVDELDRRVSDLERLSDEELEALIRRGRCESEQAY